MKVFLLWHTHALSDEHEDEKLIGVYGSLSLAQDAQHRVASQPGFADTPEGFEISEYELDKDHWRQGYATV
jgi:RimJ/RimL family protein N-acetyltransferase